MQSYKILLAEDDILIATNLKYLLEDLGHQVLGIANSKDSAIELLAQQPDFAILDIRMYGEDVGFEIAAHLNKHQQIPFIFLTSFADSATVRQASVYQPSGYLVKPFTKESIFSTMEIAMAKATIQNPSIQLKDGHNTVQVIANDILWVKSDNIYIEIKTKQKLFVIRNTLEGILSELPGHFIRCHRSFVINSQQVQSFSAKALFVAGESIPVSRTYRQQVKQLLAK